jgi:hypothetical protein
MLAQILTTGGPVLSPSSQISGLRQGLRTTSPKTALPCEADASLGSHFENLYMNIRKSKIPEKLFTASITHNVVRNIFGFGF